MDQNFKITLDTPIAMLTPRQLFEMQAEWLKAQPIEMKNGAVEKKYLRGLHELAEFLGVSYQTAVRIKASGVIDDCIAQGGKWLVIDAEAVLKKYNLGERKKKKSRYERV